MTRHFWMSWNQCLSRHSSRCVVLPVASRYQGATRLISHFCVDSFPFLSCRWCFAVNLELLSSVSIKFTTVSVLAYNSYAVRRRVRLVCAMRACACAYACCDSSEFSCMFLGVLFSFKLLVFVSLYACTLICASLRVWLPLCRWYQLGRSGA